MWRPPVGWRLFQIVVFNLYYFCSEADGGAIACGGPPSDGVCFKSLFLLCSFSVRGKWVFVRGGGSLFATLVYVMLCRKTNGTFVAM